MTLDTMIEVETKIAISDPRALIERLRRLQATEERSVFLVDTYYNLPWAPLGKSVLRLRETMEGDSQAELTFKGPPSDVGEADARQEISTEVTDPVALGRILGTVGATVLARIEKRRVEFLLEGVPVYVDDVVGLGHFVETGGPVPACQIASMQRRIADVVGRLGLDGAGRIRKSYLELALSESRAMQQGKAPLQPGSSATPLA
jgi:predicted adenylyl cyclase CyaB